MVGVYKFLIIIGKIATVYGTSWETLAEINDLANPNLIYPGDVITLPDTTAAVPEVEEVMPQVEPEMLPEEGEELLPPDDMMMGEEGEDMAPIVSGRMISLEVGNAIEDDLLAERGGEAVVGGYSDWRVPNVKELQSLVDYSKSPVVTGTPCIDDLFYCSKIINYFGEEDYGYYWSSTTHDDSSAAPTEYGAACYVVFGTAMGTMDGEIVDVHGSGAQKSDPKEDLIGEYPRSDPEAPQGDEQRVYNMVRLVRDWDDEEV